MMIGSAPSILALTGVNGAESRVEMKGAINKWANICTSAWRLLERLLPWG